MRDDLHTLLDGEDPEDIERLFGSGAFSSNEFQEFRQHQRLQSALARNNCTGRLTSAESSSILDNVTTAVGIPRTTVTTPTPAVPRRSGGYWRTGLALLAGVAIGYGVNELVAQRQVVLNAGMKEPQPTVVSAPPSAVRLNHDSIVQALSDSISSAMSAGKQTVETGKASSSRPTPARTRKAPKKRSTDAVTGMGHPSR